MYDAETKSVLRVLHRKSKRDRGGNLAETAAENGDEIMGDESNHSTRLKALANAFIGVTEPED